MNLIRRICAAVGAATIVGAAIAAWAAAHPAPPADYDTTRPY